MSRPHNQAHASLALKQIIYTSVKVRVIQNEIHTAENSLQLIEAIEALCDAWRKRTHDDDDIIHNRLTLFYYKLHVK